MADNVQWLNQSDYSICISIITSRILLKPDGDTELAQAVDVMMVQAKRIYILIIKVNKLFSFFLPWCFNLKEIGNMFLFLLSYRNTCETLGELVKAVQKLACGSHSHSVLPNFHSCFCNLIETRYTFSICFICESPLKAGQTPSSGIWHTDKPVLAIRLLKLAWSLQSSYMYLSKEWTVSTRRH